jgi:uncharacterized protein (TIGR02147 family)
VRTGQLPDPYGYLSYRRYLDDWYAARKKADGRFSHRLFMRKAGASSPSLFNEVVSGKRNLSAPMVDGFVKALGLSGSAGPFFRDLVTLEQAPTEAERNAAWARIAAHRRFRSARSIEGAAFAYLSSWYIPATRELAARADFRPEPEWIARTLEPRIALGQAREALDVLLALGLLVQRDDRWVPADTTVATAHQVQGLAVHNYHRQMLDRAVGSIEGSRSSERHLIGVTVAVPEALIPMLKHELDRFLEHLMHRCDEHVDRAERVYGVELCLFPLSRSLEESR